jgi:hypothetical protein
VRLAHKHPLAFSLDRSPIDLPSRAVGWRVSFVRGGSFETRRGHVPYPVLHDGVPLHLSVAARYTSLPPQPVAGLYRLDAVDRNLCVLDVEPAYVSARVLAPQSGLHWVALVANQWADIRQPPPLLPREQEARSTRAQRLLLAGRRP